VRDTGIGIAAEHVTSVFKEFTQADSTMTRRYGGTGLGLAISQRLVRLMGGELSVKSEVGRGSEFSFALTLPVETTSPTRTTGLAALGGRRMLIVDDNQTNRRILREMLAAEASTSTRRRLRPTAWRPCVASASTSPSSMCRCPIWTASNSRPPCARTRKSSAPIC